MSSLTLKRESKQLDFLRLKNIFWGNKVLVDMIRGWAISRCQKGGERTTEYTQDGNVDLKNTAISSTEINELNFSYH